MSVVASSLVDWSALGKICLAALVAGVGVVVVFGVLLLGLKHADAAKTSASRFGSYALSGLCGLACVGVFVVGIYAMAESRPRKRNRHTRRNQRRCSLQLVPGGS